MPAVKLKTFPKLKEALENNLLTTFRTKSRAEIYYTNIITDNVPETTFITENHGKS